LAEVFALWNQWVRRESELGGVDESRERGNRGQGSEDWGTEGLRENGLPHLRNEMYDGNRKISELADDATLATKE
jgi:hypothetical protein